MTKHADAPMIACGNTLKWRRAFGKDENQKIRLNQVRELPMLNCAVPKNTGETN